MLRILFSRLGQPHIGSPQAFAFNVPSVRASGAITVERGSGKTVRKTFTVTAPCLCDPTRRAADRAQSLVASASYGDT